MRAAADRSIQRLTALQMDYGPVWVVAIVGLALSMAALLLLREELETHRQQEFEWVARNRISAIGLGVENSLRALESTRDLLRFSDHVGPEQFREFGASLLRRHRGIEAIIWAPRITQAEHRAFERAQSESSASRDEMSDGTSEFFPVTHSIRSEDAAYGLDLETGFDLNSRPDIRALLQRARETGQMVASGRITYPAGDEGRMQYGFWAAVPAPASGAEPYGDLKGFVVGLFRVSNMVAASVAVLEPRGVDILVRDASTPEPHQRLYFYSSRLTQPEDDRADAPVPWTDSEEPKLAERIPVADRQWEIVCGRTDRFRSGQAFQGTHWVALVAGLLFTVLISVYLARIKENARQRSAMERRLIDREELFRQMTETVDEVFWAADSDGARLIYRSPAYEKILGIDLDRDDPGSVLDNVHPDDRSQLSEALARIARHGGDTEITHRVLRSDGTRRWLRTRGFGVRDTHGRVYRLVGFSEDVTERKLADEALRDSEAKLRDLFQQSPDIIMTVDRAGKILLMNRSIPALPAQRAVGHNCLALMPRELRRWFRRTLKKVFRKGKIKQFQYSAEDGTYWEGRIVPIRGEGPVSAAMVIAGDVTERRRLEVQALQNARLASIGVLAAGVAHEINNPNNAIVFNASLIARAWQDLTPILDEYRLENGDFSLAGLPYSHAQESLPILIEEITRNAERIRRIVQNLKHMSRQDTGELAEDVDIQQVLEASVMILHNRILKYTDTCHLAVPDGLPRVRGNSQQLEQVFINLLLNALQALPRRECAVRIAARFVADTSSLEITFTDQGQGIPERELARLTEPFFTTRRESGGTGLGLSISRSILERHGGSLDFASVLGEGTRVTVRLPALDSVSTPTEA
jgi:PAS domain S-box-containing protein